MSRIRGVSAPWNSGEAGKREDREGVRLMDTGFDLVHKGMLGRSRISFQSRETGL